MTEKFSLPVSTLIVEFKETIEKGGSDEYGNFEQLVTMEVIRAYIEVNGKQIDRTILAKKYL
jgi:hypothetical protein